jgi:hypothetical protein
MRGLFEVHAASKAGNASTPQRELVKRTMTGLNDVHAAQAAAIKQAMLAHLSVSWSRDRCRASMMSMLSKPLSKQAMLCLKAY